MRNELRVDGRATAKAGGILKRVTLALAIAGVTATVSGCLSVHVHKDEEQPSPVIVVPNDHTNP